MKSSKKKTWLDRKMIVNALKDSLLKLNPAEMYKKPVMFLVEIGFLVSLVMTVIPETLVQSNKIYDGIVSFILFITIIFSNFAEAVAEGRGKAQAESMRKTRHETEARLIEKDGSIRIISSSQVRKGDKILVNEGDMIPNDGEVIEGIAFVDESAITGESAPVLKEAGGDFSSVTGGTKVKSDWLKIRITAVPGESFLERMIGLVEGAARQKTPNEIALNIVLVSLTVIFLIVVSAMYPMAVYNGLKISVSTLIALLVCLIPTTIGGLLSAIGIAGMDRVTRFNVIAMSGKAVEACGDVDTVIMDKTGTVTYGNRLAAEFIPVGKHDRDNIAYYSLISSLKDNTPEGRSIIELARRQGAKAEKEKYENTVWIDFSSQTRISGIDLPDGTQVRKGASDVIMAVVMENGGTIPDDLEPAVSRIARLGGTPLVVSSGSEVIGVIYLKDTVKPGLVQRFARLREIGIKTIMCTGDNPLTAETIAHEAGVDEFVAECKPEQKIDIIKREQSLGKLVAMSGDGTNDAPALAQADVGLAMNTGTQPAKEAANMVDLDSDPTKIIEVVEIGKQLLITRGSLTTFSIANDVAKYFAIIPAIFTGAIPNIGIFNVMSLVSPESAVISALVFNAVIIPLLIPLALKGVKYRPMNAEALLTRNMLIFGLGGIITPFIGIKIIDMVLSPLLRAVNLA